eukprot:m.111684 g.111684  ORF g.111684 m.111684 type:complete len:123 (+) comp12945_c0_seq1:4369-4737(+)
MHTPATRVQGLKAQCAKTHEDTAHLTDQLRHQGILIETLSETIGAKRTELSQLRDELDTMTTKTGNFEKTISSLQRELHRLRVRLPPSLSFLLPSFPLPPPFCHVSLPNFPDAGDTRRQWAR